MSVEDHQLMRISEVMEMLEVCKSTYYELRKQGRLGPIVRVGERGVRHLRRCVEDFVESSSEEA